MPEELKMTFAPCPVQLEFEQGEKSGPPRFSMAAYNGMPVWLNGFDVPVVVDLEGMDISKQSVPVRLDHDPAQRIGHTTALKIEGSSLTADGLISHDNEFSRTVAASGKNGFPWKVSIGALMTLREDLKDGESAVVNGYEVEGPAIIARRSVLIEVSFVDYGADSTTSAVVSAKRKEQEEMENEEVKVDLTAQAIEEITAGEPESGQPIQGSQPSAAAPAQIDLQAELQKEREIYAAELARRAAIAKVAQPGSEELQAKAIAEGWSADKFELEMLRAARPAAPAVHKAPERVSEQVCEAIGLMSTGSLRGKAERFFSDEILSAAEKYVGCGFRDYAELCCGKRIDASPRTSTAEWLHAAFDATSLPGILSNTANKVLLAGYESVEDVWPKCYKKGAVSDFKTHTRYRLLGNMTLEKVGPGGELKHGQLDEQSFTQKIDTYGIMFSLTRQMIIDDDLGALYDVPYRIGIGAADAISDAVWELLLNPPNDADGNPFYYAPKGSLCAGAPLSVSGLSKAGAAFYKKTQPGVGGKEGRPLNVRPKYLLVPPELMDAANVLMTAEMVNETTTTDAPAANRNPHRGAYEILVSPYLSNPGFTGNSTTNYYLIADPNRIPAFEIAFLGGQDRPTVQQADANFDQLGIVFRGFLDFGVKEQDHRGIMKVTA